MSAADVAQDTRREPAIFAGNYKSGSNIRDMLANAKITAVWAALGGDRLWGNRGRAFWRGGRNRSVSVDDAKGLYYDHAAGDGGDTLKLIRTVRGCSFAEAVEWLANLTGTPHPRLDPKNWKRRAAAHRIESFEFARWRGETERRLRSDLRFHLSSYYSTRRWLQKHEADHLTGRWEFVMGAHNSAYADYQRVEAELGAYRKMTPEQLLPIFRREVKLKPQDPAYDNNILRVDVWDIFRAMLTDPERLKAHPWRWFPVDDPDPTPARTETSPRPESQGETA